MAEVLFGSFTMVGSQAEKVTEHQSCQSSHVNIVIAVNLVAPLLVTILPWSKLGRIFSQILRDSGILVVGWRR